MNGSSPAVRESDEEGLRHAFVAAAQDGHAATTLLQRAGDPLDDRGFPGATDGEIADADDKHAVGMAPKNPVAVERKAGLNDGSVDF